LISAKDAFYFKLILEFIFSWNVGLILPVICTEATSLTTFSRNSFCPELENCLLTKQWIMLWDGHKSKTEKNVVICFLKLNSVVLVRKRTIPTERPQPADEVSANFSW
jgi:hypothetical protein